jgi:hypothetical protein
MAKDLLVKVQQLSGEVTTMRDDFKAKGTCRKA